MTVASDVCSLVLHDTLTFQLVGGLYELTDGGLSERVEHHAAETPVGQDLSLVEQTRSLPGDVTEHVTRLCDAFAQLHPRGFLLFRNNRNS